MNFKMVGRILSLILAVEAVLMLPAVGICFFDKDYFVAACFGVTIVITAVIAGILAIFGRDARMEFYAREGFVSVGLCWILMSLMGCLPFYFSRQIPNFIDALFEIVSGFTTTGSSIIPNVELLSRGLLYWRSFSHWIGGMGVLVFLLAIVPLNGKNAGFTLHLMRAESPGPDVGKLAPKMRETAKILYIIYIALTVLDFLFLLMGGMSVFDSVCTAFGTAGTGGFGVRADSIASYSPYLQNVTTVFMLLFGINFTVYYLLLLKNFKQALKDEEIHLYLGFFAVATIIITGNIAKMYPSIGDAARHAAFQVASIMTTTGFATTNFDNWPVFSKTILLMLMIPGACAGSTGGGMKWARINILTKTLVRNIRRMLHPRRVERIRVNSNVIDEKVVDNTSAYLAAYCAIAVASLLVISFDGLTMESNISAVIACFNNIGPGFAQVGPEMNFAIYSPLSKIVLIFDMLAGRLEILPILILFTKHTWTVSKR
ncbi:MAG: TrkH family potassium uptake protein [Lachnospiraceae bacterium]|nr:TrkH family potassium uptake protein [Lachnospiraceae bacterium]